MTRQAIAIRIPTPCHESWVAMTPAATGRHCAACQKTVLDFTQKTDAEILAYFQQNRAGKTCGRFRPEQLHRPLAASLPAAAARPWQVWLAGLLVAALAAQSCQSTLGEPQPAVALPAPPTITGDSVVVEAPFFPTPLTGRVVDSCTRQPVGGVAVSLKNTAFSTTTDATGLVAFAATAAPTPAIFRHPFVLQLVAAGYPTCDFVPDAALPPPRPQRLVIVVAAPEFLMGDVEELR